MRVVGLTGGIGSGKSTVSRFLAEQGAIVVDADRVGHEMFRSGTGAWGEVVAAFGQGVLGQDGDIDRSKLGEAVFRSPESLSRLNEIMHPRILQAVQSQLEQYRRLGADVVVLEAPLLLEAGWGSVVDEVWVTVAPEAAVLRRLEGRNGMPPEEALARIHAQMSPEERTARADVLIDTDCSLDELRARVSELWQRSKDSGPGGAGT